MDEKYPQDLIGNVAASTGLPEATASRVVADVAAYYGETVDEFVRRRHAELQGVSSKRNDEIWPQLAAELQGRRFRAEGLSERQLRRIVYG
jgi:Fe-S cluster assembly scaffold protein SufB